MTPAQIELVQESWARTAPLGEVAAALFYERLFALEPGLRPVVGADLPAQRRRLLAMIAYAVKGLNRIEALRPGLEELGRRHAACGVRDEHYAAVAKALLWTLGRTLGGAFTAEVEQAWASAYALLAAGVKQMPLRQAA